MRSWAPPGDRRRSRGATAGRIPKGRHVAMVRDVGVPRPCAGRGERSQARCRCASASSMRRSLSSRISSSTLSRPRCSRSGPAPTPSVWRRRTLRTRSRWPFGSASCFHSMQAPDNGCSSHSRRRAFRIFSWHRFAAHLPYVGRAGGLSAALAGSNVRSNRGGQSRSADSPRPASWSRRTAPADATRLT